MCIKFLTENSFTKMALAGQLVMPTCSYVLCWKWLLYLRSPVITRVQKQLFSQTSCS